MKEQPFERIDELLLVKGFNKDIYEKLRPYLTIYGDGRININTASQKVLIALGLDPALVDKILKVRRGVDGKNNTADDHVFFRAFDIASEVGAFVPLEEKETRQIDALNGRNLLRVDSMLFSAASRVYAPTGDLKRVIEIVFNGITNRLEYWHEK